jgi:hypothetical protein
MRTHIAPRPSRIRTLRYRHGVKHETLVEKICDELRAYFRRAGIGYETQIEVLAQLGDDAEIERATHGPSWAEGTYRERNHDD